MGYLDGFTVGVPDLHLFANTPPSSKVPRSLKFCHEQIEPLQPPGFKSSNMLKPTVLLKIGGHGHVLAHGCPYVSIILVNDSSAFWRVEAATLPASLLQRAGSSNANTADK